MLRLRITFDGVDCRVSLIDLTEGVSWRARIMRSSCVTREIMGLCPGMHSSCAEVQSRVGQEVLEAVAWLDGRPARP